MFAPLPRRGPYWAGRRTISRLESSYGELGGRKDTADKIISALETAGVEFTNGDRPGVQLRKP
jgi:hypothetical protein